MALLDVFKKKKKKEKKVKKPPTPKVKSEKEVTKIEKAPSISVKKRGISSLAYRILKAPHITEKATDLAGKNQHVFKVWKKTNKVEIKKAIEDLYKVKVIDVKIIKVPAKKRRFGKISGWKKGYKKAIVKIKEGQKIELFPK